MIAALPRFLTATLGLSFSFALRFACERLLILAAIDNLDDGWRWTRRRRNKLDTAVVRVVRVALRARGKLPVYAEPVITPASAKDNLALSDDTSFRVLCNNVTGRDAANAVSAEAICGQVSSPQSKDALARH